MQKKFTLIIPAYNEEKRLPRFLDEVVKYLEGKDCELIMVDDGSSDETFEIFKKYKTENLNIKIIRHDVNRGKGAAIRTGVDVATGDLIIFTDADGSTPVSEINKMLATLKYADVVVGNRKVPMAKVTVRQPFWRRVASRIFNLLVRLLFDLPINDVLCGFKGLRYCVAKKIFPMLRITRWAFDVELLCLAKYYGYRIRQLPIEWSHRTGSKLVVSSASITILADIILLKLRLLKKWLIKTNT